MEYEAFRMKHDLSPGHKADFKLEDNVIDDPFCIADGMWPRLEMLNFCDFRDRVFWFHNWGQVDPKGPTYVGHAGL